MKPQDLKAGDIISKGADGDWYVVIAAFDNKVVVQHTLDLTDLSGWEKVNPYGKVKDEPKP